MTNQQFAVAAGAEAKWVQNAAMILGRRFRRTRGEARWLGLVGSLNRDLGIPLHTAAMLAGELLKKSGQPGSVARGHADGVAGVVVDRSVYDSIATARLSRALVRELPKTRGRPRVKRNSLKAAEQYGVDIGQLRDSLARTPAERLAELERNAAFLGALRSAYRTSARTRSKS